MVKVKRKAKSKKKSRGSFITALVFFVVVVVGSYLFYHQVYQHSIDPNSFTVSRVIVEGQLKYLTYAEVADEIGNLVGGQNLVQVDAKQVQEHVDKIPWVAAARVAKRYPDTLVVSLVEHYPSAMWKTTGIYDAYTQSVFYPDLTKFSKALVRLTAHHDSLAPELYDHASQFMRLLENSPYLIEEVQLDAARGYRVLIQDGVTLILGRESSPDLPLIRLNRFLLAFGQTGLKLKDISYVDLRYDNGFAVGERQKSANAASAKK